VVFVIKPLLIGNELREFIPGSLPSRFKRAVQTPVVADVPEAITFAHIS